MCCVFYYNLFVDVVSLFVRCYFLLYVRLQVTMLIKTGLERWIRKRTADSGQSWGKKRGFNNDKNSMGNCMMSILHPHTYNEMVIRKVIAECDASRACILTCYTKRVYK